MSHSRRDFFRSMAQIAAVTACAPALRVVEKMVFVAPPVAIVEAYDMVRILQDAFDAIARNSGYAPQMVYVSHAYYKRLAAMTEDAS